MRRLCPPLYLSTLLGCCLVLALFASGPVRAADPAPAAPPAAATAAPAAEAAPEATPAVAVTHTIVFLGDSLTAGYGLKKNEAYPGVIQTMLNVRTWPWTVINAGESGDTTKDALARLDWLFGQHRHVDVLFVALGGNDALRGLPVAEMRKNLDTIIGNARFKYPDVRIVLAGMMAPPELGKEYTDSFAAVFPELAKKDRAVLIPFLLTGVAGVDRLNQKDKIHPTVLGQRLVADYVWQYLEPMLRPLHSENIAASPEEWDGKQPPPPPVVIAPSAPEPAPEVKPKAKPKRPKPAESGWPAPGGE